MYYNNYFGLCSSSPYVQSYTSYTLFPPTFDDGSYTMAILGHGGWLQERGRNWAGRGETLTSSRGGDEVCVPGGRKGARIGLEKS